jgi:hypothetical protein
MKTYLSFVLGLLFLTSGCVSAPKQTVQLSEIVDTQIAEMQSSHEKFVRLYYAKCRDEIDTFIIQKWIPEFLSTIVSGEASSGKQFREDLDIAYELSDFDWETAVNLDKLNNDLAKDAALKTFEELSKKNNATLGKVLLDFSEGAQKEINKIRATLVKPINEQEEMILNELKDNYSDLLRGSSSIKGYLSSTVELVEQQDIILDKLGVLETRNNIVDAAIDANNKAIDWIDKAENVDQSIEKFLALMEAAKEKIKELKEGEN